MNSSASHPDLEWSPTSDIGCASRQVAELWGGAGLHARTFAWSSGRVDTSFHACGWICTC